ncbi:MFS transporter, AAHS family, benzoate transport protein [Sphingobium sp. AP50]|uniref:MFS transporter n=1 Tax=Sphingobium sp. AP50 TaxID=1884369 RepID=UPI0008C6B823|nr:MFS transporter [Sphingobium sp. AP50]SEK00780.1 MFS transporter, AAHS family, benzoate transport protein [Sphingobium sp. AP50]
MNSVTMAAPMPLVSARRVTWLCWFGLLAEGYDLGVFGAVLPGLLSDRLWKLTAVQAGMLASLALVGMFLGGFLIGTISDRIGRRGCFIGCIALFSAATGAAATALDPTVFGLFRFISGIGVGGMIPVASALVTEFAPPERRGREFAIMYSGYSIGIFAAALVGYVFLASHGWRAVMLVGASPLLLLPVLAAKLPESPALLLRAGKVDRARAIASRFGVDLRQHDAQRVGAAGWRMALRIFAPEYRRATAGFWAATFLGMVVVYGLNTWLPQIMRSGGYDLGPSLLFLGVFALASSAGGVLLGILADRWGRGRVIASAFLLGAVAILLLATRWPLPVTYVVVAAAGVGSVSAAVLVTAYLASYFPADLRATAVGWCLSFSRSGAIAGPMLGAAVVQARLPTATNFQIFAVMALLSGIAILVVPSPPRDGR